MQKIFQKYSWEYFQEYFWIIFTKIVPRRPPSGTIGVRNGPKIFLKIFLGVFLEYFLYILGILGVIFWSIFCICPENAEMVFLEYFRDIPISQSVAVHPYCNASMPSPKGAEVPCDAQGWCQCSSDDRRHGHSSTHVWS